MIRFVLAVSLSFLFGSLVLAQDQRAKSNTSLVTLGTTQRDVQAISILAKAIESAGGASALNSIRDFTASGTTIFHWAGEDVTGTVNLRGRGLDQFRMDASLPRGERSWIASHGTASQRIEDGTVSTLFGLSLISSSSLVLPYLEVVEVLNNPSSSIEYKGLIQIDGQSVHDVLIRRAFPLADGTLQTTDIGALDIFIDAASSHVVMTRDEARSPRNTVEGPPHEMRFSDFRVTNNVSVPFSIRETTAGQETWQVQISTFAFNSGLRESDFTF